MILPRLFGQNISVSSETGRKRQETLGGIHARFDFFVGSESDSIPYKKAEGLGADSALRTVINYLEVRRLFTRFCRANNLINIQEEVLYTSLYLLTPPIFHLLDDTDSFYRFRGIMVVQTLIERIQRIPPTSKHTARTFSQWIKNAGINTLFHRVSSMFHIPD